MASAILLVLLLIPLPAGGRQTMASLDLLHSPALFAWAMVFLDLLRTRFGTLTRRLWLLSWVGLISLGFLLEAIQATVGRSPSLHDAVANGCGATAACLLFWPSRGAQRQLGRLRYLLAVTLLVGGMTRPLLILLDVGLQRMETPMLASFEHPLEMVRWTTTHARMRRVRQRATDGSWSMRVDLGQGQYPGVAQQWPLADWSQFDQLELDVWTDAGPPLTLVIKIQDRRHNQEHDDRYHHVFRVAEGRQRILLPLADVAAAPSTRRLDLRQITFVQIFSPGPAAGRSFYVDNLRLTHQRR